MYKQLEAQPKNLIGHISGKVPQVVQKPYALSSQTATSELTKNQYLDPVEEIEKYIKSTKNISFEYVQTILAKTLFDKTKNNDLPASHTEIYHLDRYIELASKILTKRGTIVSPTVNTMYLTVASQNLEGIKLSHFIGVCFFSMLENSRECAGLFINESLSSLRYYRLSQLCKNQIIEILNSYKQEHILLIKGNREVHKSNFDDLLTSIFKKQDLDNLLIHLEIIDNISKKAIGYQGKARGKISGFTGAYLVLVKYKLIEQTLYPDQWASVFREEYATTLTAKTARYNINGAKGQTSKAFENQYFKAKEWIENWLDNSIKST